VKAFLLAAGEGRRLRPLTDALPKCLVPIRGTPLLAIWIELLQQHGVSDVLINGHYLHQRVVEFVSALRTGPRVVLTHEDELLGSAGTVLTNRAFVDGESAFLILYADNLTNIDLTAMAAAHQARGTAMTIGVSATDKPTEKGTVVVNAAGRVVEFAEKAPQPKSNLANAGVYVAG
jgi:mannose-1-phosphate guanylyltransferase